MAQPHYTDVEYTIDLDPAKRADKSYTAGTYAEEDKSAEVIDTLYFNVPHRMDVELVITNAELVLNDSALDQRMYRLSPPLAVRANRR